ncbi:hypothetical protein IQ03_01356 [Gemmobacter caeni]|uniref:Uncharacterized protein n=1 Tax=Gemmobacter caeni TaxID=589035 RepID=A0A2T6B8I5_9RHOB|nr:hypothetical protein [Gemmobacter caeni]PTX52391.1 hypothetical protein C8N34_102170 [Gemmobacter caeni]TWJ02937.1 hypothetical protein IQ03_01356 [Gemmobacter caeni]
MEAEMGVKLRDRDPIYQCWRVAAIYRCVLRHGRDRDWALDRIREVSPDGRKDHLVEVWFLGMEEFRSGRIRPVTEEPIHEIRLAA